MKEKLKSISIETPDHLVLEIPLAGIGSRILAYAYDKLAQVGIVLMILLVFVLLALIGEELSQINEVVKSVVHFLRSWIMALAIIVYGVVTIGYFILFEYFWNGSTPGKRRMKIRVARSDGRPLTLADSAIRNILRVLEVDFYPLGLIVAFIDSRNRRLGDLAAGTVVTTDRKSPRPESYDAVQNSAIGKSQLGSVVRRMTPMDYQLLVMFLDRREGFHPKNRERLAREIFSRIFRDSPQLQDRTIDPEDALEAAASLYRETTRIL